MESRRKKYNTLAFLEVSEYQQWGKGGGGRKGEVQKTKDNPTGLSLLIVETFLSDH